ncbi:hypothetical protein [uncultured Imperialibacter sp.]|uniref:beta strand repeat-containing protein n=1 Tax=uncultured Imperialibacter sp. TaxID=1672639 RepID=UPI0030DDDBC2|tara:strand:+ start:4564 stop:9351 length:4788 start_codon:yes stop_codon:yes gene_type:complete
MKFKILVFSITLVGAIQNLYAQNSVGIGTETPNQNAVLELIAINGNQGFLAPRLTAAERTAFAANLAATDNGMLVFDSDDGTLYVWYNSAWNAIGLSQLVAGDGISITGQEITNSGDVDATDDVTITTASAGDVLGRFDSLVVSGLKGLPLDSIAPSTGFGLVWNGSLWKFALDSASNQTVIPNADLLATNTQAALEELQVEILSITSGPNSIGSPEIIDGSIADADINATAAIAGTKVNPNFGTQNIITTGTVTGASFSGDGSGLTNIPATPGPNTVGSPELIDGSIADADINAAAAIAGTKVTPNFGAQNISTTGSVTASSFSGDGSGLTNIPATPGPNTVSSAEVVDGSIAFSDLNTAVVDGVTLASNGSSFEVRDNGVTTAKLVNGSVTDAKVSDVAPAKITQSGATIGQVLKWTGSAWAPATDVTGLASLTNGTLLIGDGTNTPQEHAISGHINIDNTGTALIQNGVITHDMVNDLSFVDGITLVSNGSTFEVPVGGISSLEILDGTISDADISDVDAGKVIGLGTAATLNVGTGPNQIVQLDGGGALPAVDGSNLTGVTVGAGSISTAELANDAVTSAKITNGTITDVDISDVSAAKVTGLGSAATLDAGVTTNDLVQLPSDGTLPALDGSALVNMSAAQISGLGTAAALNVGTAANNVVQLDGTAALPPVDGSALSNVTAVNFTGALAGDVVGGQGTTIISNGAVSGGAGGKIADNTITDDDINSISTAVITGLGTAAVLNVGVSNGNVVQLDATGLPVVDGSQLTNVTATGFTGLLAGDVTGTQGATVVEQVNGVTAANVATGATAANAATSLNTSGTIVARDGSGDFSANNITATSFAGDGAAITGLNPNAIMDMEINPTDNFVSFGAGGGKTAALGGAAGTDNTFFGANAGQATTASGTTNTFVGSNAGLSNTTGSGNVFLGGDGGTNTNGDFNTLIGSGADVGLDGLTNATAIGANAVVSQDNSLTLGAVGTKVGIGQSTPLSDLQINDDFHLFHFDDGGTIEGEFIGENLYGEGTAIKYTKTGPGSLIFQNAGQIQFMVGTSQTVGTDGLLAGSIDNALVINNSRDAAFSGAVEVGDVFGTPTSGMIRYNGAFEGYDGATWINLGATGIDGPIGQDILFDGDADRLISLNQTSSGVGKNLFVYAGTAATSSGSVGGDLNLAGGYGDGAAAQGNVSISGSRLYTPETEITGSVSGTSASIFSIWNSDLNALVDVSANGNVGVGATAPSAQFEVVNNGLGTHPDGIFTVFNNAKTISHLTVNNAGNVGVGNETPSSRLEVTGTGTASKIEISDTGTGDAGMNFNVSGVDFSMGIDYSDAQAFKVSSSNALGTLDRLRISRTSGETTITSTAGSAPLTLSVPSTGGHYLNVNNGTVGTQYGVVGTSFSAIGTNTSHDMVVWANSAERIRAKAVGGVDVTGVLDADDFTFAAPVTKYASYSSNVFDILTVGGSDSKFASPNAITGYHYFNGVSGALGYAMASVNLPDGAVITELAAWIWDDDAATPVRVEIVRHQHGTSAYNSVAQIESLTATALASVQNLTTTSIFFGTIDNSQYSYFLRFTGKDDNSQNTRLYNARIEYDMYKPY